MESPSSRALLLLFTAAALCPACLILDPTDFPEKVNSLPRIVRTDPAIRGCKRIDRTSFEPELFTITVVDEDVEDVLDARQFVDGHLGSEDPLIELNPQGDGTERVVTASFDPIEDFDQPGYFTVEIDVVDDASGWIGSTSKVEEDVGIIAAVWTIAVHDGTGFDDPEDPRSLPPGHCEAPFE